MCGEEKKLVVVFSNAGVRRARVVEKSSRFVTGIEVGLRSEAKAIVGERAAPLPKNVGGDDAADDLDDGSARVKRPCGDDSQPVADRSDDDGAQREARNRACVSSLCTTMPPFSIYLARCAQ
jgi:hypothetical protein